MTPQAERVEAAGLAATDQLRLLEGAAGPYIRVKCGCGRHADGTTGLPPSSGNSPCVAVLMLRAKSRLRYPAR